MMTVFFTVVSTGLACVVPAVNCVILFILGIPATYLLVSELRRLVNISHKSINNILIPPPLTPLPHPTPPLPPPTPPLPSPLLCEKDMSTNFKGITVCERKYYTFMIVYLVLIIKVSRYMFRMLFFTYILII